MNSKIANIQLEELFPNENEMLAWFNSLPENLMYDLDCEFRLITPDWISFLRRKRFELEQKNILNQ